MPRPPRVVALVVAAVGVLGAGCAHSATGAHAPVSTTVPATTTTLVPPGNPIPIDRVLPGQCFNQLPDTVQRPYAVLELGCEEAHTFQIFDRFAYRDAAGKAEPLGVTYPGETVVRTTAEQGCFDRFKPWMGIDWTKSDYDIQSWWPSAVSWTHSDRTVTCAVFKFTGKATVGSVAGAKR